MGCFDIFCILCGNPCHSVLDDDHTLHDKIKKITKWMDYCTVLSASGQIFHEVKEIACNNVFLCKGIEYMCFPGYTLFNRGVFIHDDCHKYLIKKNIYLNYANLPVLNTALEKSFMINTKPRHFSSININYDNEKYWQQDFDFFSAFYDDPDTLISPLIKPNKIIRSTIKQLNIKKNRLGPAISATLCSTNEIRLGNDGFFWTKTYNKWIQIQETPEIITIKYKTITFNLEKKLSKYPQIHDGSKIALFIKNDPKKKYIKIFFLKSTKKIADHIVKFIR